MYRPCKRLAVIALKDLDQSYGSMVLTMDALLNLRRPGRSWDHSRDGWFYKSVLIESRRQRELALLTRQRRNRR